MKTKTSVAQQNLILMNHFQPAVARGLHEHLRKQRENQEESSYYLEPSGTSGLFTLIKKINDKQIELHDRDSPLKPFKLKVQDLYRKKPELVVIWSCGLGYLPCALVPLLNRMKIIVVEPDYDILAEAVRVSDWGKLLPSQNFLLIAGEEAEKQLHDLIKTHGSLLKNGFQIIPGRNLLKDEDQKIKKLESLAGASIDNYRYWLANTIKVHEDMAAVVSGHAHKELLPVLCEEAEDVDIKMRPVYRRKSVTHFTRTDEMWWESLGRPLPYKMLTFTSQAFLPYEWEKVKAYGVKRYLWCYDDPFRISKFKTNLNYIDHIYCYDPYLTKRLREQISVPVTFMPAATTFGIGPPTSIPENLPQSLQISFVGSTGLQRQDERLAKLVTSEDNSFRQVKQFVLEQLEKGEFVDYEELMSLSVDFPGYGKDSRIVLLQDLATLVTRIHFLSALLNTPTTIFGDRGWEEPAFTGELSQLYAGRTVDYMQETPWIYQKTLININTFNLQCVNSPTVRMFDIMACGGFLLTEYRPFIDDMFRIGVELDVFRNREELLKKTLFYLENEDKRRDIANAGYDKVMREHRYRNRLKAIFG